MGAGGQQDVKRDKILEASYRRFLHYGYSKTTMNEIAADLSFSKALLYYYFPDKSQLYIAVMRKLTNNYLQQLEVNISKSSNLNDAFLYQVNSKHDFIVRNYNFFDHFRLNEQNLPNTIWEIISEIQLAETRLLGNVFKAAVENGDIKPVAEPEQLVDLLLDALNGVRLSQLSQKKIMFPQKEQLDEIHTKRLLLIDIFIKGLRY